MSTETMFAVIDFATIILVAGVIATIQTIVQKVKND